MPKKTNDLRIKNGVIAGFLLLVWLPFLLFNDVYPFFRFGMFAEPVKNTKSTETFTVVYTDATGRHPWDFQQAGLPANPAYLFRNYYYRHETTALLRRIHAVAARRGVLTWHLLKTEGADTLTVATYRP